MPAARRLCYIPRMRAPTVRRLLDAFAAGEARCEAVVAQALAAAERSPGVFTRIDADALEQAARIDQARAAGEALPALAGLPLTLKDLFNVQGQLTLAGSKVLQHEAVVEAADAVVVGRLRGAGALFIGRANMSEFAFSVPAESVVVDDVDAEVAAAFERALGWLQDVGVVVERARLPALDDCVDMFSNRAVAVFEAWQDHAERLQQRGDEYDPFVRRRMRNGESVNAEERRARYQEKAALVAACAQQMREARAEVLAYPATPCIPPPLAEVENNPRIADINLRILRNASTVNYFDGCAVSLPCHLPDHAPVGLMLSAGNGDDRNLYEIAATVESVLNNARMK